MKVNDSPAASPIAATRFVVLASERTGSNLLVELLHSSGACLSAGELLNRWVESGLQPWTRTLGADLAGWLELRRQDPRAFLDDFFSRAEGLGKCAIGFKLMHGHAEQHPSARDYLVGQRDLRVIHLGRRNLLRRLLSHKRAIETKTWLHRPGSSVPQLPAISLPKAEVWADFERQEALRAHYASLFCEHPTLELWYEDLALDPIATARGVLQFLGVKKTQVGEARHQKTGLDPLREAILNYDELKAGVPERWAAFFEE